MTKLPEVNCWCNSEAEAQRENPDLVIASLGAQRKEKPGGEITARVLFDGTHGLSVNTRTRLRDQERAPIAADLQRTPRARRQNWKGLLSP